MHAHVCIDVHKTVRARIYTGTHAGPTQVGDKIDYIKVRNIDGEFINGPGSKPAPAPAPKAEPEAAPEAAPEA